MNAMLKRTGVAALIILMLTAGCSRQVEPSEPEAQSIGSDRSSESIQEERPEEPPVFPWYDDCITGSEGAYWDHNNQLVIRNRNTIQWIQSDGTLQKSVSFSLPGNTDVRPILGMEYVFAGDRLYTRVLERDGVETLVNCGIFTLDGQLVKQFPSAEIEEVEQAYTLFEESCNQNLQTVFWLDKTHFVIDTGARLWLYDLDTDRLLKIEDYTREKEIGWQKGLSYYYGVSTNYKGSVYNGKYYYTVADDTSSDYPAHRIYSVDCNGKREEFLPGEPFASFQIQNGVLLLYQEYSGEEDFVTLPIRCKYATGDFSNLTEYNSEGGTYEAFFLQNGSVLSYTSVEDTFAPPSTPDMAGEYHLTRLVFRCIDTKTGETAEFEPIGVWESEDTRTFLEHCWLQSAARVNGNLVFFYMISKQTGFDPNDPQFDNRLWAYDTVTKENKEVAPIIWSDPIFSPKLDAFLEINTIDTVHGEARVVPILLDSE